MIMSAVIDELVQYLIKFIAMLICAFLGICVGKKLRKNKNEQTASADSKE